MSIMLQLPMPPSANAMWIRTRRGMAKSPAYKQWLKEAGWKAILQHPRPLKGAYKLTIRAERPKNRSRDCDNLIKPVNDLLQSLALVENDKYCDEPAAKWVTAMVGITVLVEPVEEAA